MGGIGELSSVGIFVELLSFPDLTQGEADVNKKNLQVENDDATLEEETKINGEMYVFALILSQMIMFIILGFEADLINLLQSFVF